MTTVFAAQAPRAPDAPAEAAPAAPPAAAPPAAAPPAAPAYPPGYAPPGYAPPGYAPPGYAPPGYAPPPGYPPPGYGYAPPTAYGGYPPPPPQSTGFHTHDGAYVRLQFGGGFTKMSTTEAGTSLEVSGGSTSFAVAVGGAVTENLVIYGTLTGTSISSPTVKVAGTSQTGSGSADSFGLGAGLAYYIEPTNLYVAGSLLAQQLQADRLRAATRTTSPTSGSVLKASSGRSGGCRTTGASAWPDRSCSRP